MESLGGEEKKRGKSRTKHVFHKHKKTSRETNCSPGSIVYTEEEMLNMSDMETEGEGH